MASVYAVGPMKYSFTSQPSNGSASTTSGASSNEHLGWVDHGDSSLPSTPRSDRSSSSLPVAYPSDLVIRNTFLDFASDSTAVVQRRRSRSLEPRRVHCEEATTISNIGVGQVGSEMHYRAELPLQQRAPAASAEQSVDSSQLSVGSSAHGSGSCKPCGFFWKDAGCSRGVNCQFCHACGPREKKQRHKTKKAMLKRAAAEARHLEACLVFASGDDASSRKSTDRLDAY
eukprot:TRINITY_DN9538_c0_g1_i2.p1 TRINITY_DN9538_c0_g1~~TRINITY_DN9538_c0_g1_i2.p1  ORF type:complete len:254 (+),score=37.49 TRINITY_DN9538_c0_g1_i2:77-763(+)